MTGQAPAQNGVTAGGGGPWWCTKQGGWPSWPRGWETGQYGMTGAALTASYEVLHALLYLGSFTTWLVESQVFTA